MLHEALADLGYNGAAVTYIWVEDDHSASEQQFVGSPTFRVDGADLFPPPPGEQYGLSCRMYTRRDGRPSPLPDPDDLRDALQAALGPSAGCTWLSSRLGATTGAARIGDREWHRSAPERTPHS